MLWRSKQHPPPNPVPPFPLLSPPHVPTHFPRMPLPLGWTFIHFHSG